MKDINYYRAKGSYSRAGLEAKKKAKEPQFVDVDGPGEEGTDELVNKYTSATPGQDTNWRGVKEQTISEEGYDTKRDRDAVMGRRRRTTVPSGGKGYTPDTLAKAKKAAMDNIKKQFNKESIDGESDKPAGRKYRTTDSTTAAARKPVDVTVDGKKVTKMMPVKREVQTEAVLKLRSQNDVRASLFDFVSEYIDKESVPNLMKLAKVIGKSLKKSGSGFMIECVLDEKKLTPAELKKREKIAKSIERDNPSMPMDKKMAIATVAAKRVAEMNFHEFRNQLDEAKATMCGRCGTKHVKPSEGGTCPAVKEEVEQLDELSPATHKRYQDAAFTDGARAMAKKRMGTMSPKDAYEKEKKRHAGIDTSKHLNRMQHGVKEEVEQVEENNSAPQTAAHRRAMLPKKVKLKGFGPDAAKGNMGNPAARAALGKRMADNEKAREALKDPKHNPSWANSKSRMESVELDEAREHEYSRAVKALKDYANKNGGIDKKDFHTAAKHLDNIGKSSLMQKGNHLAKYNNHVRGLDTDVRERIQMTLRNHGIMESTDLPFEPDAPKPAQKNSDGTKTKPMSVAKMLAKRAMKKKTMGEAKSFDQKFKDHLKFATSKSPAVQAHLKKRAAERDDMNKKNDPKAAKTGYGPAVIPPGTAYKKATKRGMTPSQAANAVSGAMKNKGKKGNLPESVEINESHFQMGQKVECIKSGMTGKVIKIDPSEEGKYYTVKQDSGKVMKYAPDELKAI